MEEVDKINTKNMEHSVKINYMRIAAGLCGFTIPQSDMDLLVSVYELVLKKKGETSVKDVVKIECDVKKRCDIKNKQRLLDKVSDLKP